MTTISGFVLLITSLIVSRLVSQSSDKVSPNSPIRSARIFICCRDSSPEIYNTSVFCMERFRHTCKSSVDFPIPGSPPTKTREPFTIPPPKTRSNSFSPVVSRSSRPVLISAIFTTSAFAASFRTFAGADLSITSSTKVFHPPHPGHCPIHLDDS